MKSTGIVRKVDELGRIVLPVELRRTMDIVEKDALEIYVDGNSIVLRKYRPSCIFCDSTKDVRTFRGRNVCPRCLRELRERVRNDINAAKSRPWGLLFQLFPFSRSRRRRRGFFLPSAAAAGGEANALRTRARAAPAPGTFACLPFSYRSAA